MRTLGVKKIWAGDFHNAYKKSLKVKRLSTGAKGVDAKAAWLYGWLIDNKHVIPNKYRVVARCAVCKRNFDPKKWDGTILKDAKVGNLVCPRCVKKAREAAKAKRERTEKKWEL